MLNFQTIEKQISLHMHFKVAEHSFQVPVPNSP